MSDDKSSQNLSKNTIQGGIVNIGGRQDFHEAATVTMRDLSATVGGMNAAQDDKAVLQKLIADLETAFKSIPTEQQANAEKIAKRAKEAVEEATTDKPDQEAVEAKANLLKKAAENVRDVMPIVTGIAINIVAQLLKMGA
ncbi:MAG: hypothetical protein IT324_15315 [Anaerolineae bacterium]|nr:hypothetical protein [Anaerolineae bacterium]